MKKTMGSAPKMFHTPKNNKNIGGMDMGSGIKAPMAKTIYSSLNGKSTNKKMGKPPKSLA